MRARRTTALPGHTKQIQAGRQRGLTEKFAQAAADAIPRDRRADRTPDGESHLRHSTRGIREHHAPDHTATNTCSLLAQAPEVVTTVQSVDQADKRWRPLRRRAFSTARPARVDMRARKPCFIDRRFLFGWYVRFTKDSSVRPDSGRWRTFGTMPTYRRRLRGSRGRGQPTARTSSDPPLSLGIHSLLGSRVPDRSHHDFCTKH